MVYRKSLHNNCMAYNIYIPSVDSKKKKKKKKKKKTTVVHLLSYQSNCYPGASIHILDGGGGGKCKENFKISKSVVPDSAFYTYSCITYEFFELSKLLEGGQSDMFAPPPNIFIGGATAPCPRSTPL